VARSYRGVAIGQYDVCMRRLRHIRERFSHLITLRKGEPARLRTGAKLVEVFGADLRSLAILRIMLALLVLVVFVSRVTDLAAHYSDQGILPRASLVQDTYVLSPYSFSLNLMNGEPLFQALLFGVAAVAALALLVGYHTRLATFVVWLLVLSIQFRNPLVLNASDILLRLLLFWSIFLPLGAVWSVDRARLSPRSATPRRFSMQFFSLATVALFLQIAFVYWFTAIWKTGDEWRVDGTALYYTLSNDQYTTQLGAYLLNFPALLTVLTFATLALEALGPFLLFSPLFTGPVRTAAVVAFVSLHSGFWLTMEVGLFPWIGAFCMVCFLPAWFWDRVLPKLRAALPGQSNMTRRGKRRLRDAVAYLVQTYLMPLWAILSSAMGATKPYILGLTGRNEWLGGNAFGDGSPAALSVEGAGVTVEKGERRSAVARSEPVALQSSLATNLLALFFLFYIFCWNLMMVSSFSIPTPAYQLGPFLGLSQNWVMFAPSPPKEDGWWVIPGNLRGGQQVDLISVMHNDYGLQEVSYKKPQDIVGSVKNAQWHKYLEYITTTEYSDTPERRADQREQRENLGRYLCRTWNMRHTDDELLKNLQIVYVREPTLPDGQHPEIQRATLLKYSCQR
jgi:hypothetical protein